MTAPFVGGRRDQKVTLVRLVLGRLVLAQRLPPQLREHPRSLGPARVRLRSPLGRSRCRRCSAVTALAAQFCEQFVTVAESQTPLSFEPREPEHHTHGKHETLHRRSVVPLKARNTPYDLVTFLTWNVNRCPWSNSR